MKHDASSYTNHGCRCEVCKADHASEARRMRAVRFERLARDPSLAPHGTISTYSNWGCRCPRCRRANARHKEALRERYA